MGAFEEVKGKAKKAIGDVADNPDLRREGAAQERKGEEERHAVEAQAKAEFHEKKADMEEQREKMAQD